jgi:hypothetical protein
MGESFALLLLLVLTIGLAAPLLPLARRLADRSMTSWKDVMLVVVLMAVIGYVTFTPASLVGSGLALVIFQLIANPLLGSSTIGQGAIAFLFVWVGAWAISVFCLACLATSYINAWWNSRSGD